MDNTKQKGKLFGCLLRRKIKGERKTRRSRMACSEQIRKNVNVSFYKKDMKNIGNYTDKCQGYK